jgi:hypothetical protein
MSEEQLKLMIEILNEKYSRLQIECIAAESAARIWKSKYDDLVKEQGSEKVTNGVEKKEALANSKDQSKVS